MKSWRGALLIFELFLFVLILVLPQVDLPDLTSHRGGTPIVAKLKVAAAPVLGVASTPTDSQQPRHTGEAQNQHFGSVVHRNPHSLRSLLCSLIC